MYVGASAVKVFMFQLGGLGTVTGISAYLGSSAGECGDVGA